jgi:hypothetical protein
MKNKSKNHLTKTKKRLRATKNHLRDDNSFITELGKVSLERFDSLNNNTKMIP